MKDGSPEWIQQCARDQAWSRAQTDYTENGMTEEIKWKRCVRSGSYNSMDDDCWTELIAAYPQN